MLNYRSAYPIPPERVCTAVGGGFLGIFIGFFCPLCVPGTVSVLSAIGISALAQSQIIFPLIAVFAIILVYGLSRGFQRHGDFIPLLLCLLGVFAIPLGRYILASAILTYSGAFAVIFGSSWDLYLSLFGRSPVSSPIQWGRLAGFLLFTGLLTYGTIYIGRLPDVLEDKMLSAIHRMEM